MRLNNSELFAFLLCYDPALVGGKMAKIDEVKARIDWLKELFKIVVTVMVADIAGMSKLYLDNTVDVLFYMGGLLLPFLVHGY
jgi:hypothetical protein